MGTLEAPDTPRSLAQHLLHADAHIHAIESTGQPGTFLVVTTTSFMRRAKEICHDALSLLWDPSLINNLGPVGSMLDEIDIKPSVRNYIPSTTTTGPGSIESNADAFSYLTILQRLPSPNAQPDASDRNSPTTHAVGYTFDLGEMEPPLDSTQTQHIQPPGHSPPDTITPSQLPPPAEDTLDNSVTETSTMSIIQSVASLYSCVSDLQKQQQEFQLTFQRQLQQMQEDQARRDKEREERDHRHRLEYHKSTTELLSSLVSQANISTSPTTDVKTPPPREKKRSKRGHATEPGPSNLSITQHSVTSAATTTTAPTSTTTSSSPSQSRDPLEDHNMEPSPSPIPSPPRVQRQYTTEEMDAAAEVQAAHQSKTTPSTQVPASQTDGTAGCKN